MVEHYQYSGLTFDVYDLEIECQDIYDIPSRYKKKTSLPLHKYGKGPFCRFRIVGNDYQEKKGLYIYLVDDEVRYIGRCLNDFSKRINCGYGNISPRNCYKGGQATNCHINYLVNQSISKGQTVRIGLYDLTDSDEIKFHESRIIREGLGTGSLSWNLVNAPE